jgi:YihY family inner membrane protein
VTAISLAQQVQVPFLAAAIAYYAFVSVVPLLVVGFTVATTLAGEAVATQLLEAVGGVFTPEASDILTTTLLRGAGRGGVTVIGVVLLVWGALRVFIGLDIAFSRAYDAVTPKSLLAQLRNALLVFGGVGLAIGATAGASAAPVLLGLSAPAVFGPVGLLVLLGLVCFPLYYVFPASDVTVTEAVPGAVFAAAGWTLLSVLFGVYVRLAGGFQLYGVLGGVLLLLVWFYFGGAVLLLGAVLNATLAGRFEDRQLQQVPVRRGTQRATMGDAGPTDDDHEHDDERTDTATTQAATGPTSQAQREREVVTRDELRDLQETLEEFEDEIEDRTVHREELERDLKSYVRSRVRRGHATGWGPYLVLLYGTVMTLGAFYFLGGGWAILAMLVVWLSTLGLYTLMILVGVTATAVGLPGRLLGKLRNLR